VRSNPEASGYRDVCPQQKTDARIDIRRLGPIIDHKSHLDSRPLQPRRDRQDCQIPLAIISPGVNKLRLIILGIQPRRNAHLIERHFDPVRMNLNSCYDGTEDRTQSLSIEFPQVAASRSAWRCF
jgi:hypothetical protein